MSDSRNPLPHNHSEYILISDIDRYITQYLTKNGITINDEKILVKSKDFEISSGEFKEV